MTYAFMLRQALKSHRLAEPWLRKLWRIQRYEEFCRENLKTLRVKHPALTREELMVRYVWPAYRRIQHGRPYTFQATR